MIYELGYVGCSLIVLVIIAYRYLRFKRVKSIKSEFFCLLIILGMLEIIFDILSSVTISFDELPDIAVHMFSQLFYLFQFILPYCTFLFTIILTNKPNKYSKLILICSLPLLLALGVWILNPFVNTLFYFDQSGMYHRANYNLVVYISAGFYLIATGISAIAFKKEMGSRPSNIMLIASISCITVTAVQFFYQHVLTTGVGIMISILLMYLYLENSDSIVDPLSGCFERSALDQYLNGGMLSKNDGFVIALSLSNFRSINTIFGMDVGDEIIRQTGSLLNDIAFKYNTDVYRIMGDIFLFPITRKKDYEELLIDLKKEINKPFKVNGTKIKINATIFKLENITYKDKNADLTEIIEFAIEKAKLNHLGNEVLLDYKFKEEFNYNKAIERYLKEAIDNKLFYMEYQPIWSLKEKRFTMIEALVRLKHPIYGQIPPDKFITIAEENGVVSSITNIVLEMVSDFIIKNNLKKYGIKNVKVNLSAMDLLDVELVSRIQNILDSKNITDGMLGFEITETVATNLNKDVDNFLHFIKENNLSLSMDDFGSGYANLENVMKIDYEVIKMDRSMLLAIDSTSTGKDVYKTIAKSFQKLGKQIVSEGVETIKQVTMLEKWGIDYIQGYYFSKPLKENDLLKLLKNS